MNIVPYNARSTNTERKLYIGPYCIPCLCKNYNEPLCSIQLSFKSNSLFKVYFVFVLGVHQRLQYVVRAGLHLVAYGEPLIESGVGCPHGSQSVEIINHVHCTSARTRSLYPATCLFDFQLVPLLYESPGPRRVTLASV